MPILFPTAPVENQLSPDGAYIFRENRWKAVGGELELPPTPPPPVIPTEVLPGTIAFHATVIPSGWLLCDGSQISRAAFANLFAYISTYYGGGNGSTTFNIPDLRGDFIRCYHHGAGQNTSQTLGTRQGDEVRVHTHNSTSGLYTVQVGPYPIWTTQPVAIGGAETRPINTALWGIIKY